MPKATKKRSAAKKAKRKKSTKKPSPAASRSKRRKSKKKVSGSRPKVTKATSEESLNTIDYRMASKDFDKPVHQIINSSNTESSSMEALGDFLPGFKQTSTQQSLSLQRTEASRSIDAWHASFGTASTAATAATLSRFSNQSSTTAGYAALGGQLSGGSIAAEMHAEVLIGKDDRVLIQTPSTYPFGCLCQLDITTKTGRMYVGTGWLISETTVVTAGHCLYAHKEGGWAAEIAVNPGRNGNQRPIRRRAASLHSVIGWVRDREPAADYGVIKLDQPIPDIGTIGFQISSDAELLKYRCHVIGYPADKPRTMWGDALRLQSALPRTITYEIDTYGGNSGGPVLISENVDVSSVGIHNYGDLRGNSATRITEEVFENLESWSKI